MAFQSRGRFTQQPTRAHLSKAGRVLIQGPCISQLRLEIDDLLYVGYCSH